jgi:hypothetical protein
LCTSFRLFNRDKKVVGVFVRFRALHRHLWQTLLKSAALYGINQALVLIILVAFTTKELSRHLVSKERIKYY